MQHQVGMVRALNPVALFNLGGVVNPASARYQEANDGGYRDVQTNPSPGTWMLIAGATAAVAGIGFALWSRTAKAAPPPPPPPGNGGTPTPGGNGGGGGGGGVASACAGDPGFVGWTSRLGNPRAVGLLLRNLGYNPGQVEAADFDLRSNLGRSAIHGFQVDFNVARKAFPDPDPFLAPYLTADECAGPKTLRAMKTAEDWANLVGQGSWEAVVDMGAAQS